MCANKCRISTGSTKRTPVYLKSFRTDTFTKSIPKTIREEISHVVEKTKNTGMEQSLTFCSLEGRDRVYVSDYPAGNKNYTEVKPCNVNHGTANKVADFHSHPTQDPTTIGITPSSADITSTLFDSLHEKIPQISCIGSADASGIHCYQPKESVLTDPEKVREYKKTEYYNETNVMDIAPYIRQNVANDFNHAWYDRKTFKRIKHPTPKLVIHDAFLNSRKLLKFQDIPELDKGSFCQLIEDLNYPTANGKVYEECRKALKINNFLGFKY